jgi:transposase
VLTAAFHVVIVVGMYVRTVKVRSSNGNVNEYVRVVEAYREDGKVKQHVVADLGRKDLLVEVLPKLQRLLFGDPDPDDLDLDDPRRPDASSWGAVLLVRAMFDQLGLWSILDRFLGKAKDVPFADRVFVLVANRLILPGSEHKLAGWLETDFICDRLGRRFVPNWHMRGRVRVDFRQLEAWYRTLDQLEAAKDQIEVALYERLRDLFSLKPDLVFYDITSTYFEGAGPKDFAQHGYSRDRRPHNVQVVVGMVMVAGWPIAHHVWAGNRIDHSTVQEVVQDLRRRFHFGRVIFVGDRGMVTDENLESFQADGNGFLVGLKRRRNQDVERWLSATDAAKWIDCPVGINARERTENRPRTRAQEVPSGEPGMRVIVVDSDERRIHEQKLRQEAMERARQKLQKLQERVAAGRLKKPEKIGAAAERIMQRSHGYRYFEWELRGGAFQFRPSEKHFEREKQIEGKYLIATSEQHLSVQEAVGLYKELSDVEQGFRELKDLLEMRPIYHHVEHRVKAHIFVAALALLIQRLMERRLQEAGLHLSVPRALQALSTLRVLTFRLEGQPVRRGLSGCCPDARRILKALQFTELRPPTPTTGADIVM